MTQFASSIEQLRASEIRDLMSLATRPDVISFAGGMPGNELFPLETLDTIYQSLTDTEKQVAMQYGPTSGLPSLLESLGNYLKKKGFPVSSNRLMITTGSLQAINILGKVFLDKGDNVLVENPCFIGATSAFRSYEANFITTPLQHDGIDMDLLHKNITHASSKPKFFYYCPNFHNPAGIIYSEEKKLQLIDLFRDSDIPILEDDVYSDLYFYEEDRKKFKLIKMMNPEGIDVCYTGSFSKILGPGLRVGWMLAPAHIVQKCELVKQSMDACSSSLSQVIADRFIRDGYLQPYVDGVRQEYKQRGEAMIKAIEKYLPDYVQWQKPRGGFYIWLHLPKDTDSTKILEKAIAKGAVFVTGKTFDPEARKNDNMRISFCNTDADAIEKGIPIIADAIREVCG